jgi:hypothetical protein
MKGDIKLESPSEIRIKQQLIERKKQPIHILFFYHHDAAESRNIFEQFYVMLRLSQIPFILKSVDEHRTITTYQNHGPATVLKWEWMNIVQHLEEFADLTYYHFLTRSTWWYSYVDDGRFGAFGVHSLNSMKDHESRITHMYERITGTKVNKKRFFPMV